MKKANKEYDEAKKAGDSLKTAECERALHIAQVDIAYAQSTPLGWEYRSLFPRASAEEGLDPGRPRKGDPDMWDRVEEAMGEGTLANLKNELTVEEDIYGSNDPPRKEDQDRKNDNDDNDDDGEFFE